jgi:hypothetical protein
MSTETRSFGRLRGLVVILIAHGMFSIPRQTLASLQDIGVTISNKYYNRPVTDCVMLSIKAQEHKHRVQIRGRKGTLLTWWLWLWEFRRAW